MQPEDAIFHYISENLSSLSADYKWKFDLKNFPDISYRQSGPDAYRKSRDLRWEIHRRITTEATRSTALQIWYVQEWGGVKANKLETLEGYIRSSDEALINLRFKGIATWSKILSVRDPSRYAIYDSRVAIALNSIQKKYEVKGSFLFPQLASRNVKFVLPTQRKIKNSTFFVNKDNSRFYKVYLEILQKVATNQDAYDLQDAEMVLFANAEKLSKVWGH